MNDNLKNRFREENFDVEEPLEGHELRFETKLMFANNSKKKGRNPKFYYLLAAACFLGLIIAVSLYQSRREIKIVKDIHEQQRTADFRLADVSFTAASKEKYFQKEIEKRQNYKTDDPTLKPLIDKLNQLEKEHQVLEKKLADNIRSEHLIDALLNNYKLRLEVLEKLQKIIHFKNKSKDNSHEKNNNSRG